MNGLADGDLETRRSIQETIDDMRRYAGPDGGVTYNMEGGDMPGRDDQEHPGPLKRLAEELSSVKEELKNGALRMQSIESTLMTVIKDLTPLVKVLNGNGEPGLVGTLALMDRRINELDSDVDELKEHGTPSSQVVLAKLVDQSNQQGRRIDAIDLRINESDTERHRLRNEINERLLSLATERNTWRAEVGDKISKVADDGKLAISAMSERVGITEQRFIGMDKSWQRNAKLIGIGLTVIGVAVSIVLHFVKVN